MSNNDQHTCGYACVEHYNEDELKCPYCLEEGSDSYEVLMGEDNESGKTDCGYCGKEMTMKLYLISRIGHVGYDEYDGFVIAANNETEARSLCNSADEGDIWNNQLDATCELIGTATEDTHKGIILESFNAG